MESQNQKNFDNTIFDNSDKGSIGGNSFNFNDKSQVNNDGNSFDSDVTKAIKESIAQRSEMDNSTMGNNLKEISNMVKIVINEIPVAVNVAGRTINKAIDIGKEGIANLNKFTNIIGTSTSFLSNSKDNK
ncbi:MAG: hypothetical protein H0X03_06155 [Nitrosopumilus sp.]|nr:hypothetical protein [Nitrosopumilus sp.]